MEKTLRRVALFLITVAIVMLPGCVLLGQPIAEKVADVIEVYCEEPIDARRLYRTTINRELLTAGHTIAVTCAGDVAP